MDTRDLINALVTEAKPVRVLRHPLLRAAGWLVGGFVLVGLLALHHGLRPDLADQAARLGFTLGICAALLTSALAAGGCLMASLPDRSRAWLLAPLPALAVWLSTVGYGCLTDWVRFDPNGFRVGEAVRCFATVLLVSVPLSIGLLALLRHAARLRPGAMTLTAGLAVAGLTSAALMLLHPLNATVMVLAWNLGAAALVVGAESMVGHRLMGWIARKQVS